MSQLRLITFENWVVKSHNKLISTLLVLALLFIKEVLLLMTFHSRCKVRRPGAWV